MLICKSFLVTGNTMTRNGAPHKDIADNVDLAINAFLKDLNGKFVDLESNVQIGTSLDTAFITITVEVDDSKKVVQEKPKEEPKEEFKPVFKKK